MTEQNAGPRPGRNARLGAARAPWWRAGVIAMFALAFLFVLDLFFGGLATLTDAACGLGTCPAPVAYRICMRLLLVVTPVTLLASFLLPRRPSWQWLRLTLLAVAVAAAVAPIGGALA
jgi:hypothetical protein